MSRYKYIGKDLNGNRVEGETNAKNVEDLEAKLADQSLFLQSQYITSHGIIQKVHSSFKQTEITRLTRQLQVLLSSGISVLEAVESIREQIDDKKLNSIFERIISSIQAGEALHEAFGKHPAYFDDLYISLLEAGELSGTLDTSLERIASYREKAEAIGKKIKSALAYPTLVILVSIVVIFVLIAYIIPIFSSMYANFGLELPSLTQNLIYLSEIIRSSTGILIPIALVLLIFGILIIQTDRFKTFWGGLITRIPIIKSFALKLATSRFCRTLGTLLSSGLQLIDAVLVSSRTTGNRYFEMKIRAVPDNLSKGNSLADSLAALDLFPKTVVRITRAGEATGRLGEMYTKAADFYESEVNTEIATLTSIIEPMIILCLGIVVAFILIAMYLPLFDLVGQMS